MSLLHDPELSPAELDELLLSLGEPSCSSCSSIPPPAPLKESKRRKLSVAVAAEEFMEHDDRGLPVAYDEDTRKARKMARNRKAAAVSRERKKQRVDELEEQVARLEAENRLLKHRLAHASSGSDTTSDTTSDVGEWWPVSQQPEAFWPYAPLKKDCTPPPSPARLRLLAFLLLMPMLNLLCPSTLSRSSTSSTTAVSSEPVAAEEPKWGMDELARHAACGAEPGPYPGDTSPRRCVTMSAARSPSPSPVAVRA